MPPARIMIATPCAGGVVTTEYLRSLLHLMSGKYISPDVATFTIKTTSGADVSLLRNMLAALFMGDPDLTHIFFLDADMGVEPALLQKLLLADKPFVGSLYPERRIDLGRVTTLARGAPASPDVASLALDYVAAQSLIREEGGVRVNGGFARTRALGGGAMLLRREVFERLREAYPDLMLKDASRAAPLAGISGPMHQCFSPMQMEDGAFASEDISFCERWIRCGGEIWACVDEEIVHSGPHAFRGKYIDRLAAGLLQK